MKSSVTELEDNKVKISVEVDAETFEPEVDKAFKRLAKEVKLPGFRPGKAPRKILEARLGVGYAREDALREALPEYYSAAVAENDVDAIDQPEIDITGGQDEGNITFDATVEVRPIITVAGYKNLKIEVPSPELTDEEIQAQIDRVRQPHAELSEIDRAATDDDHVVIDIASKLGDEELAGLTTEDYDYVVGSNAVGIAEIDENLNGASAGDTLEFTAEHPSPDEERVISFVITVKEVKESVLPELTDEFVADNTEFADIASLRADIDAKMGNSKREQVAMAVNDKTAEALANLVEDDIPDALVNAEMQNRIQDLSMRLQGQGLTLDQYLSFSGMDPEDFTEQLREGANQAARVDLALRAIVVAEKIETTDDELNEEMERLSEAFGQESAVIREQLESAGQIEAVRSDLRIRKALDDLSESVEIVDEDGKPVDRADLELIEIEEPESTDSVDNVDEVSEEE